MTAPGLVLAREIVNHQVIVIDEATQAPWVHAPYGLSTGSTPPYDAAGCDNLVVIVTRVTALVYDIIWGSYTTIPVSATRIAMDTVGKIAWLDVHQHAIAPLDLNTMTLGSGTFPSGVYSGVYAITDIAVTPDGGTVLVACTDAATELLGKVIAYDVATSTWASPIDISATIGYPSAITVTSDGVSAYVTGGIYHSSPPPGLPGGVVQIDIASNSIASVPATGFDYPYCVAVTPDDSTLFFGTWPYPDLTAHYLTPITLPSSVGSTFSLPSGYALDNVVGSSDGSTLWVAGVGPTATPHPVLIPYDLTTLTFGTPVIVSYGSGGCTARVMPTPPLPQGIVMVV